MARTKKTGQMMSEPTKEITDKIGSLVSHGRHDVLTTAIGRPEHPGRMRAARADVMIKQYFGPAPRTSRTSSSMAPKDLEQLMQKIKDRLQGPLTLFQPDAVLRLALPPEPEVDSLAARVSTKERFIDPSGNDLDTGDSENYGLHVEENPPRLVALGRLYEGSITIHNIPLCHDQVRVGVKEVSYADAPIHVPIEETLNTFIAWPTHLVKRLSEQGAMGPTKPANRLNQDVDDPLYLMTLIIPQLFLKSL
ncbi:hypothetical protein GmHk_01G001426 [Glycine max]|nr:hypothetical protein GmHk_01G001426 [Glycine max]